MIDSWNEISVSRELKRLKRMRILAQSLSELCINRDVKTLLRSWLRLNGKIRDDIRCYLHHGHPLTKTAIDHLNSEIVQMNVAYRSLVLSNAVPDVWESFGFGPIKINIERV